MPRGRFVGLGAGLLLLALSGCAAAPGGAGSPAPAPVLAGVDCLSAMPELADGGTAPTPPPAGAVPSDFVPVDVIRCTSDDVERDDGRWQALDVTHYGGDFTALLAALAEPDDGPVSPDQACPAIGYLIPPLWLVDADGGAVLTRHPLGSCGEPKPGVEAALAGLTVTATQTTPIRLVEPRAAIDAHCEAAWKYLPPSTADDGTASAVASTVSAKVCVYHAGDGFVGGVADGTFLRGRALDSAEGATGWTEAANAPLAPACDAVPTEFGILAAADGGSAFVWVELDGCGRVYGQDGPARTATPALLALFA